MDRELKKSSLQLCLQFKHLQRSLKKEKNPVGLQLSCFHSPHHPNTLFTPLPLMLLTMWSDDLDKLLCDHQGF